MATRKVWNPALLGFTFISLLCLAGCDAREPYEKMNRSEPVEVHKKQTNIVFEPGTLLLVNHRKVLVSGNDSCREYGLYRDSSSAREHGKCVVITPEAKSVEVSYHYLTRSRHSDQPAIVETWEVIRDGDKTLIRSASGELVAPTYRFGRQQPEAQFRVKEGS